MSFPYRKILGQTRFNSKNLFLTPHQLKTLSGEKRVSLEFFTLQLSSMMNHLNPNKKTILIEMDGPTGLILAHQLSATNEFNIVCISRQQNLNKLSSGAAPFYDRVVKTYANNLNWWELGRTSRFPFLLNTWRVDEKHSDTVLEQITNVNRHIFEGAFLKEIQPTKVEYEVIDKHGNSKNESVNTFNKRYLLQLLVHALTFKKYPELIVNGLEGIRPVYLDATNSASGRDQNNKKKYLGHFTNKGMILADYYILSTEDQSLERARALGLDLPLTTSANTVEDLPKPKSQIDEKNKCLSLGQNALRAGKHGSKVITTEATPDLLPIVDKLRDSDNVFVNLGYGGNCMSLSLATSRCLLAELKPDGEAAPGFCKELRYSRFKLVD